MQKDKRNHINVEVTRDQKLFLEEFAKELGVSMSDVIRRAVEKLHFEVNQDDYKDK